MLRKRIDKSVNRNEQSRTQVGVQRAAAALLALQLFGCSNLTVPAQVESTQAITTNVPTDSTRDEPDCEASTFNGLSIYGGHCVGIGCGPDEYRLNTWLKVPDKVYIVRFLSKLNVKGTARWNRGLKASAQSYQNLLRTQYDYRSDLAIQEPVNGPIEGRYSVTYWIIDARNSGTKECVIHRENNFSNRFDSEEPPA